MANKLLTVKTPKGDIYRQQGESGKISIQIRWDSGFGSKWTKVLYTAQSIFDEEVLRTTEPYVPMDTGMLRRSAQLSSDIGGGELVWATPYAAEQYYNTSDSRPYSSLAGAHWGDRSKADNLTHYATFAKGAVKKVGK